LGTFDVMGQVLGHALRRGAPGLVRNGQPAELTEEAVDDIVLLICLERDLLRPWVLPQGRIKDLLGRLRKGGSTTRG
jgi:hypothetical protein